MFFIFTIFLIFGGFFTPESLVTTLVGGIAAFGLTSWIKNQSGAMGVGAMVLALAVSVVVAIVAVLVSTLLSGKGFSFDTAATSATQIFAVATIAYKVLMADSQYTLNQ